MIWGAEPVGAREFKSLFDGLPPGTTAIARAIDPEGSRWTQDHELLATIAEVVDKGNRDRERAYSKDGRTSSKRIIIPRPTPQRRQRGTTMEELQVMFPNMRQRPKE